MTYGALTGPIGLNSYNSLFGRSAYDVQNPLDPGSMITNMTSSFLGMSGQVGWGSSTGLLSNPYMSNPYFSGGGSSLWSMPSNVGLSPFNSPYGMMPYGMPMGGFSPYGMPGYNPMMGAYGNPYGFLAAQPMTPQQPSLSWNTLISGLMSYLQTQPPAPTPMLPTTLSQPAAQPTVAADTNQVAAAVQSLAQAPLRAVQSPAPSFSATVANAPAVFTTPSGVTPPARWARSAPASNNVFAAAYAPAPAVSQNIAPVPAPVPAPAVVAVAPMPAPAPASSGFGGFSSFVPPGLSRNGGFLGGVAQNIFQNLPMINVGMSNKGRSSDDDDRSSDRGNKSPGQGFGGGFGRGKAWQNKGHH